MFQRLRPYSICKLGKASITNQAMASLVKAPPTMSTINAHQVHLRKLKLLSNLNMHHGLRFPRIHVNHTTVCCTKSTPWEPSPVTYAPTIDASGNLLKKTSNIFETLKSEDTAEAPATNSEELTDTKNQSLVQFQFLQWPMWLLGPSLLLTTGMVPTLWLPLSSVFLGPNIASLLSLIGLDCIFNLGATLFLLWLILVLGPKTRHKAAIASLLWVTNFGTWLQLHPVLWFPWWRYWDLKRAPSIPAACFLSWAYLFLCFKIIFKKN